MVLAGFNEAGSQQAILGAIEAFCHPINFPDAETRTKFIEELNQMLQYDYLDIVATTRSAKIVDLNDETTRKSFEENIRKGVLTSTDRIVQAVNFFKKEYNKVKISGLSYEYSLGETPPGGQLEQDPEDYDGRLSSIKQLNSVGFITEYTIESRVENEGYYEWDYAICKIDETKLTQKDGPAATKKGAETVIKKVLHEHEHKHEFVNSIQEKGIDLNHKYPEEETITKNKKKIALPKFPPTDWSKAEIRFITERDVIITADKKTATADFESLGFRNDKNGKPNTAWAFLFGIAQNNGETGVIASPIPNSIKQQKRTLSDRLKSIFKNDTDPFEDFAQTNTYKIKLKLVPPVVDAKDDPLGADDYLEEKMVYEDYEDTV